MLDNSILPVSAPLQNVLNWSLDRTVSAGAWLSGPERVDVAGQARASLTGEAAPEHRISEELCEVARAVSQAPTDITPGVDR